MEARSNVVSSFTIVKGSLIKETYSVFHDWDYSVSKFENLKRAREENTMGAALLKRRPATKDLAVRAVTFVALLTREASYFMRRDAPVEELAAPGSCGVAPARSEMPGRRPSRH
jgi:hypothetical protein